MGGDGFVRVAGAGPAGLTYAIRKRLEGFDVEVYEAEGRVGVKPCGEAFMGDSLLKLPLPRPDVEEHILGEVKEVRMVAPSLGLGLGLGGGELVLKAVGYMVDKPGLLGAMVEHAEALGVRVHYNTWVNPEGGYVDATGWLGAVRRRGRRGGVRVRVAPVQRVYTHRGGGEVDDGELYVEFDPDGAGYFWVFPYGDKYNAGFGGLYSGSEVKLRLAHYLKKHGLEVCGRAEGAGIVVSGPIPSSGSGRGSALSLGEAAGWVNPLLGEGNRPAVYHALGWVKYECNLRNAAKTFDSIRILGVARSVSLLLEEAEHIFKSKSKSESESESESYFSTLSNMLAKVFEGEEKWCPCS